MPSFCQRIFEYFIQDRWNPNLSSKLWRFCHRSIFQSGSLHLLLHFSSLTALFCPPSGSATHRSLTQLSFCPLFFPGDTLCWGASVLGCLNISLFKTYIMRRDLKSTISFRTSWHKTVLREWRKGVLKGVQQCITCIWMHARQKRGKKGRRKYTALDNCSSWLGCRAERLDFTTVVSHLHVLSSSLTHNS